MADSVFINLSQFRIQPNFVVALAAFWVNFCILGVLRSNAVIFSALVDTYDINREDAAWPSGIFGFFMCVTGALSGFLIDIVSIRVLAAFGCILSALSVSICCLASHMQHIILLYGAFQGIGVGIIVPLTHVILNQNFTKYRAAALGIAYAGSSAGSFVFPLITNFLLTYYGLSGTFLLIGGIMFNALLGAILFRSPKKFSSPKIKTSEEMLTEVESFDVRESKPFDRDHSKIETELERKKNICAKTQCSESMENLPSSQNVKELKNSISTKMYMSVEILLSPAFYVVSIAYATYFTSSAIFLMVVIDYASDRGIANQAGVYLVSAYSIGDMLGRLSFSWIADLQYIRRSILVRLYLIVLGTLTALLPACSYSVLIVASVLLGIVNGGVIVNHSVLLNEYLGLERLTVAMGFSTCFVGITTFLRPTVIGFFRDNHQSYDLLFVSLGLLKIFVSLIWFLEMVPCIKRRLCVENKST